VRRGKSDLELARSGHVGGDASAMVANFRFDGDGIADSFRRADGFDRSNSCVGWALRRVGTAHHYRVCAGTPFLRRKGEEWIDRMITQGFFPSPTLRRERRMGHPCEGWGTHAPMPGSAGASTSHTNIVRKQPAVPVTDPDAD
jgi:hypothetical protein